MPSSPVRVDRPTSQFVQRLLKTADPLTLDQQAGLMNFVRKLKEQNPSITFEDAVAAASKKFPDIDFSRTTKEKGKIHVNKEDEPKAPSMEVPELSTAKALGEWLVKEGPERIMTNPVAVAQLKSRVNAFYIQGLRDDLAKLSRQVKSDIKDPTAARLVMSAIVATIRAGVGAIATGAIPDPSMWGTRTAAVLEKLGTMKAAEIKVVKRTSTETIREPFKVQLRSNNTWHVPQYGSYDNMQDAVDFADSLVMNGDGLGGEVGEDDVRILDYSEDAVEAKSAGIREDLESGLVKDEAALTKLTKDIRTLESGGSVQNLTLENAKKNKKALEQVIQNKKNILSKAKIAAQTPIPPDEVEYSLTVEVDDTPIRGNAMASGDDEADKAVEDEIIERLDRGDEWAWCSVKVKASWNGYTGESGWLGGNSYADEEDFKGGGYYDDLCEEALEDLKKNVDADIDSDSDDTQASVQAARVAAARKLRAKTASACDACGGDVSDADQMLCKKCLDKNKKPKTAAVYEVLVGNIGVVVETEDKEEALDMYAEYVERSTEGAGRAAGESVTLLKDGEPMKEFQGENSDRDASARTANTYDAEDLELFIDNTSELYNQKKSIVKNVMRRLKNKTYDPKLAVKLWLYLVDAGARVYADEMPEEPKRKWTDMFPKAVREQAAKSMSETALTEIKDGTWDFLNEKGAATKTADPEIIKDLQSAGVQPKDLMPLVESLMAETAQDINSKGLPKQVAFLIDAVGEDEARKRLMPFMSHVLGSKRTKK